MLSGKTNWKRILKIIAFVFVGIYIVLTIIVKVHEMRFEQEVKRFEEEQGVILERALQSLDVSLCHEYSKQPLKCVILVGQKSNETNVCEKWFINKSDSMYENNIFACKAAVLNDLSICKTTEDKIMAQFCESIVIMMNKEK